MEIMIQKPKYIIDASSIISQRDGEPYRRSLYKNLWDRIDRLIQSHKIVTCSEISEEIKDEELKIWFKQVGFIILPICNEVQSFVKTVVTTNPKLINFREMKSSGDAFLIATAMKYDLTVITEENPKKENHIPSVCRNLNVPCVNILGLCESENWDFL